MHTNVKSQRKLDQIALGDEARTFCSHINLIDSVEMKSLFGLVYARGLFGQNTHDYHILFTGAISHPIFGAVMSAKRFAFIHAIISYDNLDSGPEKWSHDRFAAIRDFFEHFKTNYNASLQPDDYQQSMKRCMGAGPK